MPGDTMTLEQAQELARDLKEQYLADMTVDDVYALCDFILSGNMKREIENAAYERAATLIEKLRVLGRENVRILGFLVNELQGRIEGGKLGALVHCLERSQEALAATEHDYVK